MIVKSPLRSLAPRLLRSDPARPKDPVAAALWMAVGSVIAVADWLLFGLGEWHEETLSTSAMAFPHRLGRRPYGLVVVRVSSDSIVYVQNYETWTTREIQLTASKGTPDVAFFLF